jgi:hypothetical protein
MTAVMPTIYDAARLKNIVWQADGQAVERHKRPDPLGRHLTDAQAAFSTKKLFAVNTWMMDSMRTSAC